jgi:hypothetical protein
MCKFKMQICVCLLFLRQNAVHIVRGLYCRILWGILTTGQHSMRIVDLWSDVGMLCRSVVKVGLWCRFLCVCNLCGT